MNGEVIAQMPEFRVDTSMNAEVIVNLGAFEWNA
jgi:hypothetical protein